MDQLRILSYSMSGCSASCASALCDWSWWCSCIVTELQLRSWPCHDNVPNLALLLKSWIIACFKSLTWSPIQTCVGLTGLPWLPVISCRVLQAHEEGENLSTISACVFPFCAPVCRPRNTWVKPVPRLHMERIFVVIFLYFPIPQT